MSTTSLADLDAIRKRHQNARPNEAGFSATADVGTLLDIIDDLGRPWADIEKEMNGGEGVEPQRLIHALLKRAHAHRNHIRGLEAKLTSTMDCLKAIRECTLCDATRNLVALELANQAAP